MPEGSEPGIIGSTENSFSVIEQLRQEGGATVTELAESLDLSKATVHNHLKTLDRLGYLITEGDTYHLSLRFLDLGAAARDRTGLYEAAKQEIDELVAKVGEHGYVMVEENGRGVYIYQSTTERAVQTDSRVGTTVDLHATAIGKSYLAHLPDERRAALLDGLDFPERTESTHTERSTLESELATIRDQGYAFNDEERFVGMRAVGAPILGPDDAVLAAVSVAGPTTRLDGEFYREELPEMVRKAANIIGIRVSYS